MDKEARVTGWWVFAGIVLGIAGFLNVVWGIAAVSYTHLTLPTTPYV